MLEQMGKLQRQCRSLEARNEQLEQVAVDPEHLDRLQSEAMRTRDAEEKLRTEREVLAL